MIRGLFGFHGVGPILARLSAVPLRDLTLGWARVDEGLVTGIAKLPHMEIMRLEDPVMIDPSVMSRLTEIEGLRFLSVSASVPEEARRLERALARLRADAPFQIIYRGPEHVQHMLPVRGAPPAEE